MLILSEGKGPSGKGRTLTIDGFLVLIVLGLIPVFLTTSLGADHGVVAASLSLLVVSLLCLITALICEAFITSLEDPGRLGHIVKTLRRIGHAVLVVALLVFFIFS